MNYQNYFKPKVYTEEELYDRNFVKVKELSSYEFYNSRVILFTRWESRHANKDCLLKEKDKHTLKLIYWSPDDGRIIDSKYYSLETIQDIEDSIDVIEKVFRPTFKSMITFGFESIKNRLSKQERKK